MTTTLVEGLDDWVPLLAVDAAARRLAPEVAPDRRRETILETVRELLDRGLVEAGIVTEAEGYVSLEESTSAVLSRIRSAFIEDDNPEMWGYAIWLNNTPAGDALANDAESTDQGGTRDAN